MNHRKELIWNKFSEQFFYASLKLERNEKLWISNLFIQFLGEPTFDVQVFFTIGYRGWCMMQICVMSRYVIPPEFFYSCSCLDMSVIPPEELLLLLMPNSDSWCLQWSHCQLSRNICFTTFQKDSTFDVRLKYSLKIQFQPKRKSSKLGFVAMQCCGRFSYIQKAGDAGDISPPPIFWVFRQSLGGARGTHAMLWQILRLLFSHAVLLQMEVPRLPFFSSWQFVYENWIEIEIALVADLPPPHTPVLTHCAALLCCKPFFPFFLQLTRISHAVLQLTRIKTLTWVNRSHTLCCSSATSRKKHQKTHLQFLSGLIKNQDVNLSRLFSHVHVHVLVARLLQAGGLHRRKL